MVKDCATDSIFVAIVFVNALSINLDIRQLIHHNEQQLNLAFQVLKCFFYLLDFCFTNRLKLAAANSVTEENDSFWQSTVDSFEVLEGLRDQELERSAHLLPNLRLNNALGPVLSGRAIVRGHKAYD